MNWFQRNFKTIIYVAFLVPILTVAFVSISHVTKWYGISNPFSWAIYLSVGIEIAALSALAAISAQMGRKVYFPFGIVTLIQFLGNIYFAYQYIDITSKPFTDWVELVSPLVSYLGIEEGDMIGHKRFLALFAGGMLPIISLSFLHMLVKFEEEDKKKIKDLPQPVVDLDEISRQVGKMDAEEDKNNKLYASQEELDKLSKILEDLNQKKFKNSKSEIINETETQKNSEEIVSEKLTNEIEQLIQPKEIQQEVKEIQQDPKRVLYYTKNNEQSY